MREAVETAVVEGGGDRVGRYSSNCEGQSGLLPQAELLVEGFVRLNVKMKYNERFPAK
jgi:hypothetical protein